MVVVVVAELTAAQRSRVAYRSLQVRMNDSMDVGAPLWRTNDERADVIRMGHLTHSHARKHAHTYTHQFSEIAYY